MNKETIDLKWVSKGKEYTKEINRKDFYELMNSLKNAFFYDNQVSKFFCEIIPEVDSIFISKDRNEERDIPFIEYEIDGKMDVLEILRHHKIVWSILDGYTK